jgi:hypothetical protein
MGKSPAITCSEKPGAPATGAYEPGEPGELGGRMPLTPANMRCMMAATV